MQNNTLFDESKMSFGLINEQISGEYFQYIESFSDKKRTNTERMKAVGYFIKFLNKAELTVKDVETKDLEDFLIYLKSGDYRSDLSRKMVGAASIQQIFGLVKTFFQWCYERHYIEIHPDLIFTRMFKRRLPKVDRKEPPYIEPDRLVDFIDKSNNRWKALLYLLYDCGGRINTVLNIRVEEFDRKTGVIKLYESKNNIYLERGISDASSYHLVEYIDKFRPEMRPGLDDDPGYIFLSRYRTKITARAVQRYIKVRSLKELGVKLTPHSFRRSCITHMLENGAPLATVQRLVGHADPSTTARYYISNPKQLKKVKSNTHPLLKVEQADIKEKKVKKTLAKTKQEIRKARKDFLKMIEKTERDLDEILDY
jgi:integrase/recombinase XerD